MAKSIDNSEDILDSRNIQERIDELSEVEESELEDYELEELNNLIGIKDGIGDNENWEFGITFIRDSYFEEDSEEFAYDCMGIERGGMTQYVDWGRFAGDRKNDFQSIDFDGETYWYNL
jgi:hypothetical protein